MKYYILTIIAIALLIGCMYIFNHVNPWLAIASLLIIAGGIYQILLTN